MVLLVVTIKENLSYLEPYSNQRHLFNLSVSLSYLIIGNSLILASNQETLVSLVNGVVLLVTEPEEEKDLEAIEEKNDEKLSEVSSSGTRQLSSKIEKHQEITTVIIDRNFTLVGQACKCLRRLKTSERRLKSKAAKLKFSSSSLRTTLTKR